MIKLNWENKLNGQGKEDTQRSPFITTLEEEASTADQVKDINEARRGWKA